MAATKLSIFNIALFACGERALADLSEDREPRRLLDEIWTRGGGGVIRYCLEQGLWSFAMRSALTDSTPSIAPPFGYTYGFDRFDDMCRLVDISSDEFFADGNFLYAYEARYIYANTDPIYVKYVSDDQDYGGDLSLWPETFTLYVGHYMATQLAPRLKNDIDLGRLEERTDKLLISARLKESGYTVRPVPPIRFDDFDHRQLDYALELLPRRREPQKQEK